MGDIYNLKHACSGGRFPCCTSSNPFSRLISISQGRAQCWRFKHILKHFCHFINIVGFVSGPCRRVDVNAACGLPGGKMSTAIHCRWCRNWARWCPGPQSSQAGYFSARLGAQGPGSPPGLAELQLHVCSPQLPYRAWTLQPWLWLNWPLHDQCLVSRSHGSSRVGCPAHVVFSCIYPLDFASFSLQGTDAPVCNVWAVPGDAPDQSAVCSLAA